MNGKPPQKKANQTQTGAGIWRRLMLPGLLTIALGSFMLQIRPHSARRVAHQTGTPTAIGRLVHYKDLSASVHGLEFHPTDAAPSDLEVRLKRS